MASSHPAWSHWSDATVLDDYAMTTTTTTTTTMPLCAFLVQDGHSHGQLVGLCLLAGEDAGGARGSDAGDARNVC